MTTIPSAPDLTGAEKDSVNLKISHMRNQDGGDGHPNMVRRS